MPCHAMHPMQDLFLESFSQVLLFYMCSYLHKKFYFCKKWVSHDGIGTSRCDIDGSRLLFDVMLEACG
jgi:hypothetical protein